MKVPDTPIILMADDDDDDCLLARDAFNQSGNNVIFQCVEDGIKLLEHLANAHSLPALILLDLNMPRKDGHQALKDMKAIPRLRDIPVVVFTTSREENDIAFSREIGANSFVTKPTLFDDWKKIMRSLADEWLNPL